MTSMVQTQEIPDPRTDPAALDRARNDVSSLVCGMPGDPAQAGFEHPWEIRAFAMAVTAHRELSFDWTRFQAALIESIEKWESERVDTGGSAWSYYQHWVVALEQVLAECGVVGEAEVDSQMREVLGQPPNRNHHEACTEPIAIDRADTVTT